MNTQRQAWRDRASSHYENIKALLRERAEQGLGVKGSELYADVESFGRSPRNRISELRRDGWNIRGKPTGESDWFYWLKSDNLGREYPTKRFDEPGSPPRPRLVPQPQLEQSSLFDMEPIPAKPVQVKSWEQVCAERDEKMQQEAEPDFKR